MDIDKLKEMKKEEFMEYAEKISMGDEKYSIPYVKVRQLLDFIQVLDKNEKDYQDIMNTAVLENKNLNAKPTSILGGYIILEIYSFYEYLKRTHKSPEIPDYYDTLRKFRGKILGHLDETGGLKKGKDWMEEYKKIDKIGIKKIIEDFFNIYKEFVKVSGTKNNFPQNKISSRSFLSIIYNGLIFS